MKQDWKFAATLAGLAMLAAVSSGAGARPQATPEDPAARSKPATVEARADEERARPEQTGSGDRDSYRLSMEQLDQVHGGMINNESPPPVPPYGSDGRGVTCRHTSCAGL
jgi:hypothetical protein